MRRFSSFKHIFRVFLFPALLFSLFLSVGAGQAQASSLTDTVHCASLGNLIDSRPIYSNGTKIGELDVYYNSSTGYNCAYTRSGGPSWGVAKHMYVTIMSCPLSDRGTYDCSAISIDNDPPNLMSGPEYSYYAGPVGVYGKGYCIVAIGAISWQGAIDDAATWPVGHCG